MKWIPVMDRCLQGLVSRNIDFPCIWDLERIQDAYEEILAHSKIEFLHFDNTVIGLCNGDQ